jgi:hypothetical protein
MNRRSLGVSAGALFLAASVPAAVLAASPKRRSHPFTAAQLEEFMGRYYLEPDVLPQLSPYVKKALGRRYPAFLHSIRSQNSLRMEDGVLHGFGEQVDTADRNASMFLFGPHGEVFAAIKRDRKIETFGDAALLKTIPSMEQLFREFAGTAE